MSANSALNQLQNLINEAKEKNWDIVPYQNTRQLTAIGEMIKAFEELEEALAKASSTPSDWIRLRKELKF